MAAEPDDHVARNVAEWTANAAGDARWAPARWARAEPVWGIWGLPEAQVGLFDGVRAGDAVLEVGCGTAYVSAWLARRDARPVGLDPTPAQLATARRLQAEHGLAFPLVQGIGELLPFADATFDLVISEYGAAIWSDQHRWIREAARVLRPGGELRFLGNSTLLMLCVQDSEDDPATAELRRPLRGLHRMEFPDSTGVEFHLSHGDRIRLLRSCGLEVVDLQELYAEPDARTGYGFVDAAWASRWPSEEIWRARKP